MKVTDQVCQNRISIAEIDHHQRDCRKQNPNNKNILFHAFTALVGPIRLDVSVGAKSKKMQSAVGAY